LVQYQSEQISSEDFFHQQGQTFGSEQPVHGFFPKFLPLVKQRLEQTRFLALFSFVSCTIAIGLMATVGFLTHSPFIFPSLGPTAFLFFTSPTAPSASPRNAILGHIIGVLAGYLSLVVTGLTAAGPLALPFGPTLPRIIAVMISLGVTASLMVMLRVLHPPAGATTLMISLGLIAQPWQLVVVVVAVVLLTMLAFFVNRLIGIPVPLWKTAPQDRRNE
jgi:CBS domain-containing membrane protein